MALFGIPSTVVIPAGSVVLRTLYCNGTHAEEADAVMLMDTQGDHMEPACKLIKSYKLAIEK